MRRVRYRNSLFFLTHLHTAGHVTLDPFGYSRDMFRKRYDHYKYINVVFLNICEYW